MTTYTSSLPDEVLAKLSDIANELRVPKNRLIERALSLYLENIERQLFIRGFQKKKGNSELLELAEMGGQDFLAELEGLEDEAR